LKDAVIKLRLVDKDGNLVSEAPANVDPNECTLFVSRLGTFYIALFAYKNEDDAENHRNPIAMSEILQIKSVNEKGETGEEVVTYADITFKNGYAYFGEAPLEFVTDKALTAKIAASPHDHEVYEYNGERYTYDSKDVKGAFKYVPIEWRVLKKTDKYALLMTNSIIKGGGYDGFAERNTTTWKNSCLYYMLNDRNNYKKSEITYSPVTDICDRVLITMKLGGVETKIGIPTVDLLTKAEYGFSTSKDADKNRIVKPSVYYSKTTNNNVGSYANYWVVNKTAGKAITVDKNGKINEGTYKCNVYEIGTVLVVKVNLELCNVIEK
nr:hypothetical protein [Lachnospiraceae bacterium]